MPLFEIMQSCLQPIRRVSFSDAGIREREHIQQALVENISPILDDVLVIGDEQNLWADANRRVDLLCIDRKANLVVMELKRDETAAHAELQALRYTAMLSTMTFQELCEVHQKYLASKDGNVSLSDAEGRIRTFLGWEDESEVDEFNIDPRIVLVSSNFSKELTNTVLWLNTRGLDISCVRMIPYKNGDQILVDVQKIIPVPEAEDYQVRLRKKELEKAEARSQSKDYTRYNWRGQTYWKNQLAHAIVLDWVTTNRPASLSEILEAFPDDIHPYMIETLDHAERMEIRDGRARHYKNDDQLLKTTDGQVYCVTRGWTIDTITRFIAVAKSLGYEISIADH